MKINKFFWSLVGLILWLSFLGLSQTLSYRLCIRVIDGDTIVLDGSETIRLIGVDTPETKDPRKPVQYYGQEAYEFTRKLVEGKKVRLEYDQDRIDKYGRTLAYVYLEDGTHVNAQIILMGFGHAYTQYPFKYMEAFRSYEKLAREAGHVRTSRMAVVVVVGPGHNLVARPNCVVLGHSYYEDMHLALSIGDFLVDAMGKAVEKTSKWLMAGMSHM